MHLRVSSSLFCELGIINVRRIHIVVQGGERGVGFVRSQLTCRVGSPLHFIRLIAEVVSK